MMLELLFELWRKLEHFSLLHKLMRNQDNSGQTGTRRLTQQLTEAAVLLKDHEIPKLNLINYVFRKCATPNLKDSK